MDARVEIGLLGPTGFRLDGMPVEIAGAPQRVVLARLALSTGRVVSTAELLDALWPSEPPPNALGNLRSYVSRLRRQIGAELVLGTPGGYRLAVSRDQLDVGQAEELVAMGRSVRTADAAAGVRCFAEALALWRGDPLSDLPDPLPFAPSSPA